MSFAQEILRQKKQELTSQISELRKALREIDTALEVLDGVSSKPSNVGGAGPSTVNSAILEAIRQGNGSPADIFTYVTQNLEVDTTKQSISTRLSKLKHDGLIHNDQDRWALVEKAKGSDASTSEPSTKELGPATGRGTGFPSTPPEGSIPSGSTASQTPSSGTRFSRDLDDEIPF